MKIIYISYIACILVNLIDALSSMGFSPDMFEESNPLMRDSSHQFVLWKALIVKAVVLAVMAGFSWLVYVILSVYRKDLAVLMAALLPLYITFQVGIAALGNIFLKLKYYNN